MVLCRFILTHYSCTWRITPPPPQPLWLREVRRDVMWPFMAPAQTIAPLRVCRRRLLLRHAAKAVEEKQPTQTQHSRRWRKRPVNKGGTAPVTSDTLHRLPAADGPRNFHSLSDTHVHAPTHNICCFNPSWVCERSKTMKLCPEDDVLIHFHESDTSIKSKQPKTKPHWRRHINNAVCVSRTNTACSWGWSVCYDNSLRVVWRETACRQGRAGEGRGGAWQHQESRRELAANSPGSLSQLLEQHWLRQHFKASSTQVVP